MTVAIPTCESLTTTLYAYAKGTASNTYIRVTYATVNATFGDFNNDTFSDVRFNISLSTAFSGDIRGLWFEWPASHPTSWTLLSWNGGTTPPPPTLTSPAPSTQMSGSALDPASACAGNTKQFVPPQGQSLGSFTFSIEVGEEGLKGGSDDWWQLSLQFNGTSTQTFEVADFLGKFFGLRVTSVTTGLDAWGDLPAGVTIVDGTFTGTGRNDSLKLVGQFCCAPPVQEDTPAISVSKVTEGEDGLTILVGTTITWTYVVTNVGNVALANVTVTDSDPGVTPVYASGDTNNNGLLDLDEVWVFTATGIATRDDYRNTATASGTFGTQTVTDTDGSSYFGADPKLTIVKTTGNADKNDDGLTILAGREITWFYQVSNTGNVALADVTVTDSVAGVNPVYVSGDEDEDGLLDVDEVWIFTATGTATSGPYSNTGTASGSFTDDLGNTATPTASDASSYFGAVVGIAIDKKTNGLDDGGKIVVGSPVTWTYEVRNTGNVALANVTVTDDNGTPDNTTDDFVVGIIDNLAPGASVTLTWTGTATSGLYSNTGTASGSFTDDLGNTETKTADDTSGYIGITPYGFWGLSHGFWKNWDGSGPQANAWGDQDPTTRDPFRTDSFEKWAFDNELAPPNGGGWDIRAGAPDWVWQVTTGSGRRTTTTTLQKEDITLGEALGLTGGGQNALAREATAAMLNAWNENDELARPGAQWEYEGYRYSLSEIQEAVSKVLKFGTVAQMTAVKDVLEFWNSKIQDLDGTMYDFDGVKNGITYFTDYTDYDFSALFGPQADDANFEQYLIFGDGNAATNDILLAARALIGGDWGWAFA